MRIIEVYRRQELVDTKEDYPLRVVEGLVGSPNPLYGGDAAPIEYSQQVLDVHRLCFERDGYRWVKNVAVDDDDFSTFLKQYELVQTEYRDLQFNYWNQEQEIDGLSRRLKSVGVMSIWQVLRWWWKSRKEVRREQRVKMLQDTAEYGELFDFYTYKAWVDERESGVYVCVFPSIPDIRVQRYCPSNGSKKELQEYLSGVLQSYLYSRWRRKQEFPSPKFSTQKYIEFQISVNHGSTTGKFLKVVADMRRYKTGEHSFWVDTGVSKSMVPNVLNMSKKKRD